MWRPLVLVSLLVSLLGALLGAAPAAAELRPSDGAVLSALVANAASQDLRVDVISTEDVRKALDAESRRQLAGCSDTSCLTEIASAMNAAAVIHGSVGTLGSDFVLSLSLLDTTRGVALGRASAKAPSIATLGDRVEGTVATLLKRLPAPVDGKILRVLVMDIDVLSANPSGAAAASDTPLSPWVVGGGALMGIGALGVVTGAALDGFAAYEVSGVDASTTASAADEILKRRAAFVPVVIGGYAVGAAALLAGGGIVAMNWGAE